MAKSEDNGEVLSSLMSYYAAIDENNRQFVKSTSAGDLSNWFLKSYTTRDFSPFDLKHDPSVALQIKYLHSNLEPIDQNKIRNALTNAVSRWDAIKHGNSTIGDLALTAAYIRAEGVVPSLVKVVDERQIAGEIEDDKVESTWGHVVGVVAGFAPSREVEQALRRWFYEPSFPYPFIAQVMTGLTECAPNEYPAHITRFLDVQRQHPESFARDICLANIIRIAEPKILAEHLHELPDDPLTTFARLIQKDIYETVELQPLGIRNRKTDTLYTFNSEDKSRVEGIIIQILSEPADPK